MENRTSLLCRACNTEKPIESFENRVRTGVRNYSSCLACKNTLRSSEPTEKRVKRLAQRRVNYAKNPQRFVDTMTKSKYGYTSADRDRLIQEQNFLCKICGTDTPNGKGWCLDHNHATKAIRGVLCHSCNLLLGHAKDNVKTLSSAIEYLNSTKEFQ